MGRRGPQKGAIYKPGLDKARAREELRRMVMKSLGPMLRAQIAHAQGIGHVFTRDKGGKFTRIEDMDAIDKLLSEGTEGEHYWIFAKDPSVQAFTTLIDQAIDQAPKHVELTGSEGGPLIVHWKG